MRSNTMAKQMKSEKYKVGDTSFDQAKVATPNYAGNGGSCSNFSCHKGNLTQTGVLASSPTAAHVTPVCRSIRLISK